jgi:hypothetical protein
LLLQNEGKCCIFGVIKKKNSLTLTLSDGRGNEKSLSPALPERESVLKAEGSVFR